MKPPIHARAYFHRAGHIAFDAAGRLEFTLAQVEELADFHMAKLKRAIKAGDSHGEIENYNAERLFTLAMQDHANRFSRASGGLPDQQRSAA